MLTQDTLTPPIHWHRLEMICPITSRRSPVGEVMVQRVANGRFITLRIPRVAWVHRLWIQVWARYMRL
jgi:hypothetical protein